MNRLCGTVAAPTGERRRSWPTRPGDDRVGFSRREALGVVGIIWGWNGPMGRLGREAGEALVAHAGVDKIAFTGSTATGKHVQALAAETLKRVTLELGGKSPTVVFPDADLPAAARGAAAGFLGNAGQACVAGSRILVHESIRDQFIGLLRDAMATIFAPHDPFTPGGPVGALATRAQFDRVSAYVDIAREEGARVVTGGHRYGDRGYFFAPTLLDNVTAGMRVVREEIFGPVGVIMTFTDLDDALAKANDTEYGLAASVWTTSLATAHRMAAGIQAGTVWVNTWGEHSTGALPFGGYKQSGLGREGGLEVLDAYTQSKAVLIAL